MDYELLLTPPGGGAVRNLAQLAVSLSWSGSVRRVSRELRGTLAVPRDGSLALPPLEEGAVLTLRREGRAIFTGPLLSCTTSSQDSLVDLSALDRGRFLTGNEGWYRFTNAAPETAAAAIARDFGIPVGKLAAGVPVSRKFPGVTLEKIIRTMYALSGEQSGKRYLTRFTGEGALEVVEKPTTAALTIASTMEVVNTWDISNLQNSVAIYTESGALVRRVEDATSLALNGRLEHVLTQRSGQDAQVEAKAWLEEHGLSQTLTVETLGDLRLVTGEAVLLRDTGSGVSGLFWIDADTHTWKNGQYFCKLTLNFRNLLDNTNAGSNG